MTMAWTCRLSIVLAVLLSCACTEPSRAPQPARVDAAATTPQAESFCREFRDEEARLQGEDEPRTFGWPTALPGMTPLERHPAPPDVTAALLGQPCSGGDLWAVPVAGLTGRLVNIEQEFVAVREPSIVDLGNGRTAFFAIAAEGHYHAAHAFGLIAMVDVRNPSATPLLAMPGAGTWGVVGGFSVPRGYPAIWSAAGDYSFGEGQGWAGVTDVSLSEPRSFGNFPTFGQHTCLYSDAALGAQCRGAWEYVVTSIDYAPGGLLTLTWRLDNFDEKSRGEGVAPQRLRQTSRTLTASYRQDGVSYSRVSGEEPPRFE